MKVIFLILLALMPVCGIAAAETMPYAPIIISEVGANEASDTEWVEIYNLSGQTIDLTGWKFFEEQTNHGLKNFQGDYVIEPSEYAIIANKADLFKAKYPEFAGTIIDSSWSSLKEAGEEIGLKDPELNIIELFIYQPSASASIQKINLNDQDYSNTNWQNNSSSNSVGRPNEFLSAEIAMSTEEPTPTDTTGEPAPTEDSLTDPLIDDSAAVEDSAESNVNSDDLTAPTTSNESQESSTAASSTSGVTISVKSVKKPAAKMPTAKAPTKKVEQIIVINELFPNPYGSDANYEFIELKNISDKNVNLKDWHLTNKKGYQFTIPDVTIYPQSLFVFARKESHLALDNHKDEIKLFNQENKVIDQVKYNQEFADNYSYQLINKEWKVTARPTQAQENQDFPINLPPIVEVTCDKEIYLRQPFTCDASDSYDMNGDNLIFNWELKNKESVIKNFIDDVIEITATDSKESFLILTVSDGLTASTKEIKLKFNKEAEYKISASASVKKKSTTTKKNPIVTVQGKLTAPVGMLGKNEAYLEFPGKKLILAKGVWPILNIGDEIKVTGKLGTEKSMSKITIAKAADITFINANPPPQPILIDYKDIGTKYLGALIQVGGTVSDLAANNFALGEGEHSLDVYLKRNTKISSKNYKNGEKLTVAGILQKFGDDYQLLPRSKDDIINLSANLRSSTFEKEEKIITTPVAKGHMNYWLIGLIVLAGIALLYYKIRDLTPAAVQVDGMAAGPNQEKPIFPRSD